MLPSEYTTGYQPEAALHNGIFTVEECIGLQLLRHALHTYAEYRERCAAERRLQFARWLVEHGKLNEGFPVPEV